MQEYNEYDDCSKLRKETLSKLLGSWACIIRMKRFARFGTTCTI